MRSVQNAFSLEVAGNFIGADCMFNAVYGSHVDLKLPQRLKDNDLQSICAIARLLAEIVHDIDEETGMVKSVDAFIASQIIEDELREYFQVHPKSSSKDCFRLFIKKIEECVAYLKFQVA